MSEAKSASQIKDRKLIRKSTYIILVGILILGSLTVFIVQQAPSYKDAMKAAPEVISGNLLANLTAFKKTAQNEHKPFSGALVVGDELSFKVSVLRPTFVGLLVSINQQKPVFTFYGRLPPGENHRLGRQGHRYLYTVTDQDKALKFCTVYADDKKALQVMNNQLASLWSNIPATACLSIP